MWPLRLKRREMMRMLLLVLFVLCFGDLMVAVVSAGACNSTCGNYTAPFPFGFSDGCPIPLRCSRRNSSAQIGEFRVRNITADGHLLLDVPPSCDRTVEAAGSLYAANYGVSNNSLLVLRNCPPAVSNKSLPEFCGTEAVVVVDDSCGSRYVNNVSCFYNKSKNGFVQGENVTTTGCRLFITSFTLGGVLSVDINTVELAWWLKKPCQCSSHAELMDVDTPQMNPGGCRCRCSDGFQGDGFAGGTGCQKEDKKCSPAKYMTGECNKSTTRYGLLIGGVIAGAATMAAAVLVCCFIRRHTSLTRKRKSMRRLLSVASCTVPLYSHKDIEKATDGFSDERILGTGAYGTVYAGKFGHDREVAVKKIKNRDRDSVDQVMNEIRLLSSVSHPNLVRLLGCCVEQGEQILVYEYMPHGTLAQHLQRERGPSLPWTVRLAIATDTAKAIAYLHTAVHPPIYHRDIKTSNILLDHNYNSKVADFGLSRMGMTETSHISTAPQGTPGYVDPQYHQNFHLSDKSDVYSFGVVLVEIITAMKAVDFSRPQSEVNLAALAIDRIGRGCVDEIIDPYLEPHRDAWTLSSIHKVAELAFRCLAFHRDVRPSMTEVADELEQIKLSGWAPADDAMFLSTASSFCSSPSSCGTERPRTASKSRRLMLMNRILIEQVNAVESPVSVQDPWRSEHSSPSANSLLGNVVQ